ncbi:hypothetical protein [Brevundimonas sp.]|uniref:hypothetical protein n=1 Tax=Brevundimonas sp. TaxID=1871086 RepID=UPI0025B882FC|nr:hypothetical protein [Brevundimonas sp.]
MLIALLAAAVLQQASTPAAPEAGAPAAVSASAAPAPNEDEALDRQVCRREAVVGSRFNSRVCMTRREWNQRREESRRLAHRLESANANRNRQTAPGH